MTAARGNLRMIKLAKTLAAYVCRVGLLYIGIHLILCTAAISAQNAKPEPRWGHAAKVLGSNLYIVGGRIGEGGNTAPFARDNNFVLSLDLTKSFATSSPPWKSIKASKTMPEPMVNHAMEADRKNNRVLAYGGVRPNYTNAKNIWAFSPQSQSWVSYVPKGGPPGYRFNMDATMVNDVVYDFGGTYDPAAVNSTAASTSLSDLYTLSTNNMTWTAQQNLFTKAGSFSQHTLSYVPSRAMLVVIGGSNNGSLMYMNSVQKYQISTKQWSTVPVSGTPPANRIQHTAVTYGEKIVVYGGCDASYTTVFDDVAVLDVATWSWSKPKLQSPPPGRYDHTATRVGDHMLVAFGYMGSNKGDDGVYALSMTDWKFVDTFPGVADPDQATTDGGTAEQESSGMETGTIVGLAVGGILAAALLVAGTIFMVRHFAKKRRNTRDALQQELASVKQALQQAEASNQRSAAGRYSGAIVSSIVNNRQSGIIQQHDQPALGARPLSAVAPPNEQFYAGRLAPLPASSSSNADVIPM
ncbi:hypothetical protein THASP1DRAFT_29018 [Thamnocephalis sphaerospora]|uniref:Attractin/MKLN-like beta-propeller domain-containing protein n=1 Tax=Thamnocephalis sphaerospora TaxID=78915 RepID=A0A4P9XSU7_9FUNG|nr:hypothetical protein THASP1DRAFT_29018 [Thamnocephalis sphaerospora]|eukprot:RKP09196.1 hypothetical protein THASP1DRAFT_29018 [Thamnocephalis sphaerospora]